MKPLNTEPVRNVLLGIQV